ncbi:uncharacterized protein Dana_GF11920, isoform A [Drosophila ananassae]|uniref:Uncharacterized protein, isoform A n=2 Tax=Drosophila ananassae TaxID=7217 RepID=B3MEA2_DROAN|nr:uncharacterized protein LOC6494779 isoform X1 [Drosophila ananassae]EDV36508.1 uncharacterized protein Dana_GF11920, isoform A [Drosophila ananassae]
MAPVINGTASTISSTIAPLLNTTAHYNTTREVLNTTVTPIIIPTISSGTWNNNGYGWSGVYYYWYPSYILYIVLVFMFVIAFPLAVIMSSAKRKREAAARNLAQQRLRARRQMEIQVTNNNCNGSSGSSGGADPACGNGQNITVLPKSLDLPPSYDEAAFSDRKQDSTLTIATCLEASNPNLAAGGTNEPPPVYEANVTTTTTTTFMVNGQPPVL